MGGPWEQFQHGPWTQFQSEPTARSGSGFTDNREGKWGGIQSFAHGAWQGLGDEIMAATAAAKESLSGGLPFGKAYDQALTIYRGARDDYRQQNPVASLATEGAGALATGVPLAMATGGTVSPAANLSTRVAQNVGLGAAQGGVYGFNEGEGGASERAVEAGKGAALGGAIGGTLPAIGAGVGRVITPVRSQLSQEEARLAQIAAQEGIDLTPAQVSGSRPLKTMESVFESLPWTSATQKEIRDAQRAQFNRAVLKRAGIDADNASPEVLQGAQDRIGGEFKRLAQNNTVQADQELLDGLARAETSYKMNLPPDQQAIVSNYVNSITDLMGQNGGVIPGEAYQQIRSAMTSRARNATDPSLRQALKEIRNAFDDAASRSVSHEDGAAWDAARRQYANLKVIERAMGNSQVPTVAGNIQPTALASAVRGGNRDFARGGGDLNDLSRVGAAFIRDNIPNSGTAERTFMQNMLTGGGLAGAGAGMAVDPVITVTLGALGYGGPKLAQALYNSGTGGRYLNNRMIDGLIPSDRRAMLARLLAQGGGATGGAEVAR